MFKTGVAAMGRCMEGPVWQQGAAVATWPRELRSWMGGSWDEVIDQAAAYCARPTWRKEECGRVDLEMAVRGGEMLSEEEEESGGRSGCTCVWKSTHIGLGGDREGLERKDWGLE